MERGVTLCQPTWTQESSVHVGLSPNNPCLRHPEADQENEADALRFPRRAGYNFKRGTSFSDTLWRYQILKSGFDVIYGSLKLLRHPMPGSLVCGENRFLM